MNLGSNFELYFRQLLFNYCFVAADQQSPANLSSCPHMVIKERFDWLSEGPQDIVSVEYRHG